MRYFIKTYGCQMNVNESQKVDALLRHQGFEPVSSPAAADLILVNTCSVREKPENKVFSLVGRLKSPKKVIGVMGCVAQQHGENLLKKERGIDFVIGTQALHHIPEVVSRVLVKKGKVTDTLFTDPETSLAVFREPIMSPGVSAYVTIMQGCNRFCSYCIVPYVRGRERSRSSEEIIEEIRYLARRGVKEVVLLGQNVNRYGLDRNDDLTFPQLLRKIEKIEKIKRVRFVTSHPADLNDEIILLFGELETVCESIHLPFQSGSDRILGLMGRGYTRAMYLKKIEKLREVVPEISISADVIVGFPGETERDFSETLSLIETVQFDTLFSFRYTPRPLTRSIRYAGQVPEEIKLKRLKTLQTLQSKITLKKNRLQEGKIKKVLVEKLSKHPEGFMMGRTRDNRIVNFKAPERLAGQEIEVRILEGYQNSLLGKVEERHVH